VEVVTCSGFPVEALRLHKITLEKLMKQPDFYEFYNPLTRAPGSKVAPIFGWSAALFIDLSLQETAACKA